MHSQSGKTHNKILLNISLFIGSIIVSLLICELIVRILGLAPDIFLVQKGRFQLSKNTIIGYELVPHFESTRGSGVSMIDFNGKANSLGFRDREHNVGKQEGVYRIIVLGDSITQGQLIEKSEDIFTSVLERELRKANIEAEVLNFGVNGYNTRQEVETLREKGLKFSPDLVIVAYCINDSYVDSGGIEADLAREKSRSKTDFLKSPVLFKSALLRLLWAKASKRIAPSNGNNTNAGKPQAIISKTLIPEALRNLRDLAQEKRFKVLVVMFPMLTTLHEPLSNPRFPDPIEKLASDAGFYSYPLTRELAKCNQTGTLAAEVLHPNAKGHECTGKAIAQFIEAQVLKNNIKR